MGKVSLGGNFNFWAQWKLLILNMGNITGAFAEISPPLKWILAWCVEGVVDIYKESRIRTVFS